MILLACNKKTEILQLSWPSPHSLYLHVQFNHVFAGRELISILKTLILSK